VLSIWAGYKKNNLSFPWNSKEELSGIGWYYGFMKRNPNLSIRTAEDRRLSQATSFNHHISTFFIVWKKFLKGVLHLLMELGFSI
jgi:hypothetical protein